MSLGAEGIKQELGRVSQHCARGREPFSSGEKFGETASLHFDGELSRTLQIALSLRNRGYFAERAGESA